MPPALPDAEPEQPDLGRSYSFTGDFLSYTTCPRQYALFIKYGFVPSRGTSRFFGQLVHRTIEDLHNLLMAQRTTAHAQAD